MKSASSELKVSMKQIKIDDIEDLHDGTPTPLTRAHTEQAATSWKRLLSSHSAHPCPSLLCAVLCCAMLCCAMRADMSDLLEDADEVNEIMGRAYGVPEELDEDDLMNGQRKGN